MYICNNDTAINTSDVTLGRGGNRELVFVNVGMVLKISPSRFFVWKLITICRFDRQSFMMVIFTGHTQNPFKSLQFTLFSLIFRYHECFPIQFFLKYGKMFTQSSFLYKKVLSRYYL